MFSFVRPSARSGRSSRWIAGGIGFLLFFGLHISAASAQSDGETIYKQSCIICHGAEGRNGFAPELTGTEFLTTYRSYADLYRYTARAMPKNKPASLSENDYLAVVKYVLALNGKTVTDEELKASPAPTATRVPATPKPATPKPATPAPTATMTVTEAPVMTTTPSPAATTLSTATPSPNILPKPLATKAASPVNTPGPADLADMYVGDIEKHPHYNAIERALTNGWMSARQSGEQLLFEPAKAITRAELIQAIVAAKKIKLPLAIQSTHRDLKDHPASVAIEFAIRKKWIPAVKSGQFKPDGPISRADAAVLLSKAFGIKPLTKVTLKDVNKKDTRAGAIAAIVAKKALSVDAKKLFSPAKSLTRADAAAGLNRLVP